MLYDKLTANLKDYSILEYGLKFDILVQTCFKPNGSIQHARVVLSPDEK